MRPFEVRGPNSACGENVIEELWETCRATPWGAIVEVGVYQGGTAFWLGHVAQEQQRPIFCYDTYQGMPYANPEEGDSHRVGDFGDTSIAAVRAACPHIPPECFIEGIFPNSFVPPDVPITFVHLDCDQYFAIRHAVQALKPLMGSGGIMWFDDPASLDGARHALEAEFDMNRVERTRCFKHRVVFP